MSTNTSPAVSIAINQIVSAHRSLHYVRQTIGLLTLEELEQLKADLATLKWSSSWIESDVKRRIEAARPAGRAVSGRASVVNIPVTCEN